MPLEDGPSPTAEDADRDQDDKANRPSKVEQCVAGPSNTSQRQGFCSYCQVLYNSVEQHILSTRHRELVGRPVRTNVAPGSLMQRFLQDVLQHHPHRYNDTRPSHADLPSVNTLPSPREVLSEVYSGAENDGLSIGTREELPSSDEESCPVVEAEAITTHASQSQEEAGTSSAVPISTGAEARAQTSIKTGKIKLEHPLPEKFSPTQGFLHRSSGDSVMDKPHLLKQLPQTVTSQTLSHEEPRSPVQSGSPKYQHRKAHRKTNKHKEDSDSCAGCPTSPATKCITSEAQQEHSVKETAVQLIVVQPWNAAPKKQTFSDQSDQIREVIEEVIERHCYAPSPKTHQQDEESVFHLSLHSVNESKDSEEWDNALLGGLEKNSIEAKHLACLMQVNIHVEDQDYKAQLDTALNTVEESGQLETELTKECPAEEIIPDLPHIPPSFVGKTWEQVRFEDDLKIERMVKEFRQGHFRCYFESEPMAKSGKHRQKGKKCARQNKKGDDTEYQDVLPLMENQEEEEKDLPAFRKTRRLIYRMASRCQVVKVSHGTQTTPLNCPVVRRSSLPETGTLPSDPEPRKDPSPERTPDMKTRLCALKLPASYCKIMSPLQPKTVVYVLASPDGALGSFKPTPIKRIGRKRKSSDEECMLKYKYKKTPLKYYDPQTNRILKTPPRGMPSTPKNKSASHIRQLFRSLSPDINKELHGSVHGQSPRGSRKSRGEGSLAASTSGSCLDSGGPSEPGSSLPNSPKALFSRSSISTSSHFLLGHIRSTTSLTGSSSRAKAHSRADSSRSGARSKLEEDQTLVEAPAVRRRKQGPRVIEKPLNPAKKPPTPPYRTKRKFKARAKSRNVIQRRAAGCRVSPRNKTSTRASPRLSGSFQLDL